VHPRTVAIEGAAVGVEISRQVLRRRGAEARVAPRRDPALERIEAGRVERQRMARREQIARERALAGAHGGRSDIGRE
jgi:hypothetical protein